MKNLYSIEARSYDLVGIASHNFWVLRDNEERAISQLHGLATDRHSNRFKPIGFFNDRLGFYEFKTLENDPTFILQPQQVSLAFQADKEDVFARWNRAASKVEELNDRDLDYSPFGIIGLPIINSNSAYHLFARLMEVECCRFSGVLQPGIKNSLGYCYPNTENVK